MHCVSLLLLSLALSAQISLAQKRTTKVFGVGLSKTGTTTLALALEQLTYTNIHYDRSFIPFMSKNFNFSHFYDNVDSVEDLPTSYYYEELLKEYPDAKFIHTIREREDWYKSFHIHNMENIQQWGGILPDRIVALHDLVFGSAVDNKTLWLEHYDRHNARVPTIIPKDQLLSLAVDDPEGFPKLCTFLGETVGPCGDGTKFLPRGNSKEDREKNIEAATRWLGTRRTADMIKSKTKYAYASLLSYPMAPDFSAAFKNFVVAVEKLRSFGSTQDVVALLLGKLSPSQTKVLDQLGVIVVPVSPFGLSLSLPYPDGIDARTAIIRRSVLRAIELEAYRRVLYFDPRAMFVRNCDELFLQDTDLLGRSSDTNPLETSMFVIRPSWSAIVNLNDITMSKDFSQEKGWLKFGPRRDGGSWDFEGATTAGGLLYYYYFCKIGGYTAGTMPDQDWNTYIPF